MKHFIPAAGFKFLTPIYDFFSRTAYAKHYKKIASLAARHHPQKILDIGCGPGNLIVELKKHLPEAEITGLDIDPEILSIAEKKLNGENIKARLMQASAAQIPLHEKFDAVASTLMFHHLSTRDKLSSAAEVFRLLKDGGAFYLFDFGPPRNFAWKILAFLFGLFENIDDAVAGRYCEFLREAGFRNIKSVYRTNMFELLACEK